MNESLVESCREFEQLLLAGMLRSATAPATGAASASDDAQEPGDDAFGAAPSEGSEGYAQLFAQALAGAVERAGGIGIAPLLAAASESRR